MIVARLVGIEVRLVCANEPPEFDLGIERGKFAF